MATIARMTRSSLLEVLGLDYIRTARAKGLVLGGHSEACPTERSDPDRDRHRPGNRRLTFRSCTDRTVFALPGMGTALVMLFNRAITL